MALERFVRNNGHLGMHEGLRNTINRNGFPYSQIKRKYAKLK
jgi:hypothetical protein